MLNATDRQAVGYASPDYAQSLSEFGEVLQLPRCGGYLLKRNIPGTHAYDAMGSYPLFFCQNWSALMADLADLPSEIVSVSLVADPYGPFGREELESCFNVVNPFKRHYVIDLTEGVETIGTKRHRKQARAALRKMEITVCERPADFLADWLGLYQTLIQRHEISGIRAFSEKAFTQLFAMTELVVHRATRDGELIGAQLFLQQDDVVYCHLGAVSELGYKLGAFYALDQFSFDYFSGSARKLDIGGGVGLSGDGADGLSDYKKGWSTSTNPVYFCGLIRDDEKYSQLCREKNIGETNYFPAYRLGEFS